VQGDKGVLAIIISVLKLDSLIYVLLMTSLFFLRLVCNMLLRTIQKVLSEFESLYGLKTNPEKSTLFCIGVPLSVETQIVSLLKMCEGKLHVWYLGVLIISSQLCAADCDALLGKITVRINSWLSRNLSFVGRLQLVSIVFECIALAFSYYLRRSLELLNKSSIVYFGMVRMKGLLELKFLGICCVCLKKREVWALRSLRNGTVLP
jgi:hypothetical protein